MRRGAWLGIAIFGVAAAVAIVPSLAQGDTTLQGPYGGGRRFDQARPDLTEEQREAIVSAVRRNVAELLAEGRLALPEGGPVLFEWPLRPANGLSDFGYHGTSPYMDHDSTAGLEDFSCSADTYDGHRGTDITLWPFPWKKVLESKVEVIAAAAGTIVFRQDGYPDQSCEWAGQQGNGVTIQHSDGTSSIYWHMKTGSVTIKTVDETVETGEYLGVVASSGVSSWPHLHFEVWDSSGTIDPFAGPCNDTTVTSRWVAQRPHRDTAINKLTTGYPEPSALPPCPTVESPNERKDFQGGSTIYFTAYYRDQRHFQPTFFEVLRPDGTLYTSWSLELIPPAQIYDVSYWFWSLALPFVVPSGTWTWRATFEGTTYEQLFNVGVAAAGSVPSAAVNGPPLTVEKAPAGAIKLTWGDSCKSSDSTYSIYEGTLGSFYSHTRRVCSTGGEKTWTFSTARANDVYWLVVPRSATRGGSYGTDSSGAERPEPALSSDRCVLRQFECPGP